MAVRGDVEGLEGNRPFPWAGVVGKPDREGNVAPEKYGLPVDEGGKVPVGKVGPVCQGDF